MPTFGSVFSGCGGMDLGFEQAGWEPVWRIEWNADCQKILRLHSPCVPVFGDASKVQTLQLEAVDLIIGGFPCTDISLCSKGSKQNFDGPQSGLVREFGRIVKALQPKYFVIENVPKLLSLWPELMTMGYFDDYEVEGKILDVSDFGAYSRRKRAFFVGHFGKRSGREILDFSKINRPTFRTGGREDKLPMCLPWKGGVSLERLGACVAVEI